MRVSSEEVPLGPTIPHVSDVWREGGGEQTTAIEDWRQRYNEERELAATAAVPPLLAARLRQLRPDKLLGPLWAAHAQRDRPAVGLEEELEGEEAAATPLGDNEAD